VGFSTVIIPEPSTCAMMPLGFAGRALASYRRAKATQVALAPADGRVPKLRPSFSFCPTD
jgi:hypothetical protein